MNTKKDFLQKVMYLGVAEYKASNGDERRKHRQSASVLYNNLTLHDFKCNVIFSNY